MRKMILLLLTMALFLTLTACGGESSSNEDSASESGTSLLGSSLEQSAETPERLVEIETNVEAEEPAGTGESAEADDPAQEGGTLIAYFSWSGNTEKMAQTIQEEIGGDLFQIEPAVPYTDDYDALLDIAQQEQADNARPELAAQVENWDSYEAVFVGFPNWWSDAPMAVYTFLESYDFSGKTLIPFNTSASGGFPV